MAGKLVKLSCNGCLRFDLTDNIAQEEYTYANPIIDISLSYICVNFLNDFNNSYFSVY